MLSDYIRWASLSIISFTLYPAYISSVVIVGFLFNKSSSISTAPSKDYAWSPIRGIYRTETPMSSTVYIDTGNGQMRVHIIQEISLLRSCSTWWYIFYLQFIRNTWATVFWRNFMIGFLLQPAWLPPLPSVDVTANLPGYIILSGYQIISYC